MKIRFLFLFLCIYVLVQAKIPTYSWVKNIGGADYDLSHPVAVDDNGNVYISGSFSNSSITLGGCTLQNDKLGYSHFFIAKFDPNGNVLWLKGGLPDEIGSANAIKVDKSGNVFVCGYFSRRYMTFGNVKLENKTYQEDTYYSTTNSQAFLVKYDSFGNALWGKCPDNVYGNSLNGFIDISVDDFGSIYTTGYYTNTISFDKFVL